MGGPSINRAESSGDIWTPWEFIRAVEETFNLPVLMDLAATHESTKAKIYVRPEDDSLKQDWDRLWRYHARTGIMWLNPPYSNIAPWAKKCAELYQYNEQVELMLLVPASVGANWFWDHVWPYATVYSVGRMVFDNCFDRKTSQLVSTVYPKDLILAHYTNSTPSRTLQRWQWKSNGKRTTAASDGGG